MKRCFLLSVLILSLPAIVLSADLRNLSVFPAVVSPGQQATISFEYYVGDYEAFAYYGAISNQCTIRNADTSTSEQQFRIRENCMDCGHGYVDGGRQSVQHETAGWRPSGEIDSNIVLTVPSNWQPGTYYIIIAYKLWNIYANPDSNHTGEQCFEITVAGAETPTYTVSGAITNTPVFSLTNTPTITPEMSPSGDPLI